MKAFSNFLTLTCMTLGLGANHTYTYIYTSLSSAREGKPKRTKTSTWLSWQSGLHQTSTSRGNSCSKTVKVKSQQNSSSFFTFFSITILTIMKRNEAHNNPKFKNIFRSCRLQTLRTSLPDSIRKCGHKSNAVR